MIIIVKTWLKIKLKRILTHPAIEKKPTRNLLGVLCFVTNLFKEYY